MLEFDFNSFVIDFEQQSTNRYDEVSNQYFKEEGMLIVGDDCNDCQSSIPEIDEQQSAFLTPLKIQHQKISKSYRFPRESKNYYKNIGPKLANYIKENFDESIQVQLQPFLDIKNQKHNKKNFQMLCQSKLGQAVAQTFFQNYRWAKDFVNDDLNAYFRLNDEWKIK